MGRIFEENEHVNLQTSVGVSVRGEVSLAFGREEGVSRGKVAEFTNMVLDSGLDFFLGAQSAPTLHLVIGSGSTPVSAEQTSLAAFAATMPTNVYNVNGAFSPTAPYEWRGSLTVRFAAGVGTGVLAEVGVASSSANNSNLISRALIKGLDGLPTTLVKEPDEYLDFTYTLVLNLNFSPTPFTLNLSTGVYDCVISPVGLSGSKSLVLGNLSSVASSWVVRDAVYPVNVVPSRTGTSGTPTQVHSTYVKGSFTRGSKATWGLTILNPPAGSFPVLTHHTGPGVPLQISFDPPLPKTSNRIFSLDIRHTVGRA